MAKVELKKPVVAEISENIKDAQAVVLVSYCGITVEADTALRKELREAGITYKVYKNTMMNFAFKDTDCEPLSKHLEGPNAIAISKDDATAPARATIIWMRPSTILSAETIRMLLIPHPTPEMQEPPMATSRSIPSPATKSPERKAAPPPGSDTTILIWMTNRFSVTTSR